jgi:hypothetical protein
MNKKPTDKRQKAVSCVSTKLFLSNKEYADFIYRGLKHQLFDCLDHHLRVDKPILIELQAPTKITDTTMMETTILQELVLRDLIRCKDCKWKQGAECVRFAEIRPFPNDFCSRGERRDDNETERKDDNDT